jgi:hypothetical protein
MTFNDAEKSMSFAQGSIIEIVEDIELAAFFKLSSLANTSFCNTIKITIWGIVCGMLYFKTI